MYVNLWQKLRLIPKKYQVLSILFIVGTTVILIFHSFLLRGLGNCLVYKSPLQTCQAAFVLGGSEGERLETAIELYKKGFVQQIVLATPSSVPADAPYRDILSEETKISQGLLDYRKIPENDVVWSPSPLYSTYDELIFIRDWAMKAKVKSLILVSGWFQSRRVYWASRRLLKTIPTVLIVPASQQHYSAEEWWKNMGGVINVENECLKNLYYLFKVWG